MDGGQQKARLRRGTKRANLLLSHNKEVMMTQFPPNSTDNSQPVLLLEWWKPIPGFEELYEISNLSNINRLPNTPKCRKRRRLKPILHPLYGYMQIILCKEKNPKTMRLNVLMAKTFFGECPKGHIIDHINFDRAKNWLSNLQYITQKQNIERSRLAGRYAPLVAAQKARSPLTTDDVIAIRTSYPQLTQYQ
jgi:hypothetical protein